MPPRPLRVVAIATHPIQYQVPWFRALAATDDLKLEVLYRSLPNATEQGKGFGIPLAWDIPLLDGYPWQEIGKAGAIGAMLCLRRHLTGQRPDAVLLTGWHSGFLVAAALLCRLLGVPTIVRGESNALRQRPIPIRLAHRALLACYDAFLAIGKSNRHFYDGYGVAPSRLFDCRYFVDNDRFSAQRETLQLERPEIRAHWNIPAGSTCFLFAGKLEEKKRITDLLAALERALQSGARMHLLVVGDGELRQLAMAQANRSRLPVTFAGFLNQSHMARAYTAADCLVLPSDHGETWGLVVNEAMACGLPAIVSDRVGCGQDLVVEGVTGFTFPFANVARLADLMTDCALDPVRLGELGSRAREHVRAYSIENAARATLDAVRYVTGIR